MTLGRGNGSRDDPVLNGGSLRVFSPTGSFDLVQELPPERWRYVKREGDDKGYKFRGTNAVRVVLLKPGKVLKITAKGPDLELLLTANPEPVHVILTLGERRYCMTYGGEVRFKPDRKYRAKRAPRPSSCGPDETSAGTESLVLPICWLPRHRPEALFCSTYGIARPRRLMPPDPEQILDDAVHRQEPLRLPR